MVRAARSARYEEDIVFAYESEKNPEIRETVDAQIADYLRRAARAHATETDDATASKDRTTQTLRGAVSRHNEHPFDA